MADTPYVFVIHGTWNPPRDPPQWHQLDESDSVNFCKLLNDRLETRGLGRPVWRRWGDEAPFDGWTGANRHADRMEAADRLYQRWQDLLTHDPTARIHVVAHSHGCNVTLRAVERYVVFLHQQAKEIADFAERAAVAGSPSRAVASALAKKFDLDAPDVWQRRSAVLRLLCENDNWQGPLPPWSNLSPPSGPYAEYLQHGSLFSLLRGHWMIVSDAANRLSLGFRAALKEFKRRNSKRRTSFFAFPERALRAVSIRATQAAFPEWVAWHWTLERLRSRRERFIDGWAAAEATNRLGSLCLMGAPYYSKILPRSFFRRWSSIAKKAAGRLVDVAATYYLIVLIVWTVVWAAASLLTWSVKTVERPVLNPLDWPPAVALLAGLVCVPGIIVFTFVEYDLIPKLTDLNPYFREEELPGLTTLPAESKLPLRTLVIHAGILDEVSLGFSAEPLVFSGLQPQIHMLLKGSQPDQEAKREEQIPVALGQLLTRSTFRVGLRMTGWTLRPLVVWFWERFLTVKFVQVASALALGLNPQHFESGLLRVSHSIKLPRFFDEYVWNVTELLVKRPPVRSVSAEGRDERFAFLWDDQALERAKSQSLLWPQFLEAEPSLARRYRLFPQIQTPEFMKRLAQTTIMLEQRMTELVGSVDLVHSAYYVNDDVIDAIAEFLAAGRCPPAAKPGESAPG